MKKTVQLRRWFQWRAFRIIKMAITVTTRTLITKDRFRFTYSNQSTHQIAQKPLQNFNSIVWFVGAPICVFAQFEFRSRDCVYFARLVINIEIIFNNTKFLIWKKIYAILSTNFVLNWIEFEVSQTKNSPIYTFCFRFLVSCSTVKILKMNVIRLTPATLFIRLKILHFSHLKIQNVLKHIEKKHNNTKLYDGGKIGGNRNRRIDQVKRGKGGCVIRWYVYTWICGVVSAWARVHTLLKTINNLNVNQRSTKTYKQTNLTIFFPFVSNHFSSY